MRLRRGNLYMHFIRSETLLVALASCFLFPVYGSEELKKPSEQSREEVSVVLTRKDNLPAESIHSATDPYFEGYIQALVDLHYYEYRVVVLVKNHKVWLANLPKNKLTANSIVSFVKDIPEVKEVIVLDGVPPEDVELREKYVRRPQIKGIWFPQMTELFQPLIADPRQVSYTLGYRAGDHVIGVKCINIALGDDFPIYRWLDVFRWHGDLQIGIEAGIWTVFNMDPSPDTAGPTELVNTDFYVGVPITYAVNQWSFRFRGYHISSHLGDEYMVNHPGCRSRQPQHGSDSIFILPIRQLKESASMSGLESSSIATRAIRKNRLSISNMAPKPVFGDASFISSACSEHAFLQCISAICNGSIGILTEPTAWATSSANSPASAASFASIPVFTRDTRWRASFKKNIPIISNSTLPMVFREHNYLKIGIST